MEEEGLSLGRGAGVLSLAVDSGVSVAMACALLPLASKLCSSSRAEWLVLAVLLVAVRAVEVWGLRGSLGLRLVTGCCYASTSDDDGRAPGLGVLLRSLFVMGPTDDDQQQAGEPSAATGQKRGEGSSSSGTLLLVGGRQQQHKGAGARLVKVKRQ